MNRERLGAYSLDTRTMANGSPNKQIDEMKWPLLKLYTTQLKRERDQVAAVRSKLYKLRTVVDTIGVDSDEYSPKETGQFDKYCMPMPLAFGKPPPRRGTILLAVGSAGKMSCSWIAAAEGESSTHGGFRGSQ
jgi:hypothetical protein